MGVFELQSRIQAYEWGSESAIAEYFGRTPSGGPEAELWMGAHTKCPSPLRLAQGGAGDLASLIGANPAATLGETVFSRWGELPFLFKVLAAGRPLSLQAHPSAAQAEAGYAKEEQAQVPLSAVTRNYKDRSHKPELVYALSRFTALCGFRPVEEAVEIVRCFAPASGAHAQLVSAFASDPTRSGLSVYFQGLFELSKDELQRSYAELQERAGEATNLPESARSLAPWLVQLAQLYPSDPGLLASQLLNLIVLEPGEALFLPAGNLHAYLSGLSLEIMANSDNVLRGGLTSKHVDVPELCSILSFDSLVPQVLKGEKEEWSTNTLRRFVTPAPEFELTICQMGPLPVEMIAEGPEIWLVLEGELAIGDGERCLDVAKGAQVFLTAGQKTLCNAQGEAVVARAALPVGTSS